jgi:hypothetical protein
MISGNRCIEATNFLLIQGTNIQPRSERALLADYFYLSPNYQGTVTLRPLITNILINCDLFLGLDDFVSRTYVRLYSPLTWTRWDLNIDETVEQAGTEGYPAGYFTPGTVPVNSLLPSFLCYASGHAPLQTTGILNNVVPAITGSSVLFEPLTFAQLLPSTDKKLGLPDIRLEFGYTVTASDDYHGAINVQVAVPTGGKIKAHRLFAAQLGTHNWELGAGFSAHYSFWRSCDRRSWISFYCDGNFTHLFSAAHDRTFDLICSPLSRYMLAVNMGPMITDNLMGGSQIPSAQFKNSVAPVANLTTLPVRISIGIQADIVALIHMTWHSLSFECGYNFWAKSCEDIRLNTDCRLRLEQEMWALKGDARVFGFLAMSGATLLQNHATALSAAESQATIFSGTNNSPMLTSPNSLITAPQLATADSSNENLVIDPGSLVQINTSINPHILTLADVDLTNQLRGISHKVFGSVSYNYHYNPNITGVLSVAGFVEFGSHPRQIGIPLCFASWNKCQDCAVSQWAIFIKLGVAFAS